MSDNYLRLIPSDSGYVPTTVAANSAVELLSGLLPEAWKIEPEFHGRPTFIDQEANLERITCPMCKAVLEFDSATADDPVASWWYSVSEPIGDGSVAGLEVRMLCCGASAPFDRLVFEWPAGVASFEISILNPGVGENLESSVVAQLEAILACPLRQIWAHY